MELYHFKSSPRCRSVRVLAKQLNLDLKLVDVNVINGDHTKPEYHKMNPFNSIPTLKDNGLVIYESQAIMLYLVKKYSPDSSLYPKDLDQQAVVDSMLHYDSGTLHAGFVNVVRPLLRHNKKADAETYQKIQDNLKNLNDHLATRKFAAGDNLTLADVAIIHTLSLTEILDIDVKSHSNVENYMSRVKGALQCYGEINDAEVVKLKEYAKAKMYV